MDINTEELLNRIQKAKEYKDYYNNELENLNFKTLQEYLLSLLKEKNKSKSDVLDKANLSQNYGYQLFNGIKTNPSRDKIIMLSFGFELDLNETRQLLKISNLQDLYAKNPRDSMIIYAKINNYDLIQTNILLQDMNQNILE